ncbi:arylalkylamine N-acetyltransferase 1-like isoform X2 [Aphis gossypii]|nr:arylalkylamine N-acetyltransferase 1-like isoform X2 [Aphis gossypii]XP_050053606.1 arylalkylamine N-acetyltransferase 1-like isoform X2 [Aphis gossypii]XP_050053607.1 arylalkylamine N-acetyltransferase 1-like isoform X2 [Aphis gossypii]
MDKMKKTKISFNIVPISSSNEQGVINSIEKYFIQDEPLNASVELFKEEESVLKYRNFCTNLLYTGLSLMAVSETGEIMGAILNSVMSKEDYLIQQYGDENFEPSSRFDDIEVLLNKVRRDIDLFGQYPNIDVDRIMELKLISVNEAYRGQGVCKALVKKSKELALELGYQMMYVECLSYFAAKAMERFGFQCIYSLSYSDYVDKRGKVVFDAVQPPHECIKVQLLLL